MNLRSKSREISKKLIELRLNCVLVNDTWVKPSQLAFNSNANYAPYLYALPYEFKQYTDLWNKLNIQQECKPQQLETILRGVHKENAGKELTPELQQVGIFCSSYFNYLP
jgi:hypothetical protein